MTLQFTINNYECGFSLKTPSIDAGYRAIGEKAIGNAAASLIGLVAGPLVCLTGAAGCALGAVSCALGAVSCAATGAFGLLLATPIIAVKDLAHHTYRVLNIGFNLNLQKAKS